MLYAVGDSSLLWARASDLAFSEYSYQGRSPTAFRLEGGQAYVSISAYEHAGASTLLVFRTRATRWRFRRKPAFRPCPFPAARWGR